MDHHHYLSAYQATVTRDYPLQKLARAILKSHIESPLPPLITPARRVIQGAYMITPNPDAAYNDAPMFTQPMWLDPKDKVGFDQPSDQSMIVFDARPYLRWDRRAGKSIYTSVSDFSFNCTRISLMRAIYDGEINPLGLGDVPGIAFVRWISNTLSRVFALDLEHQERISVAAAYYYFTLAFGESLSAEDINQLATTGRVKRITLAQLSTITEIGDVFNGVGNLQGFVDFLKEHSGSAKLDRLNVSSFVQMFASHWLSTNGRENVILALDHYPTLLAMIYASIDDRNYRRSVFTSWVETAGRRGDREGYARKIFSGINYLFEDPAPSMEGKDDEKESKKDLLNDKVKESLRKKMREHNEKTPQDHHVTAKILFEVFRRGVGSYRSNPDGVSEGVNSAEHWAYGRVGNFLKAIREGKFKGRPHDTDLLPEGHPKSPNNKDNDKDDKKDDKKKKD